MFIRFSETFSKNKICCISHYNDTYLKLLAYLYGESEYRTMDEVAYMWCIGWSQNTVISQ